MSIAPTTKNDVLNQRYEQSMPENFGDDFAQKVKKAASDVRELRKNKGDIEKEKEAVFGSLARDIVAENDQEQFKRKVRSIFYALDGKPRPPGHRGINAEFKALAALTNVVSSLEGATPVKNSILKNVLSGQDDLKDNEFTSENDKLDGLEYAQRSKLGSGFKSRIDDRRIHSPNQVILDRRRAEADPSLLGEGFADLLTEAAESTARARVRKNSDEAIKELAENMVATTDIELFTKKCRAVLYAVEDKERTRKFSTFNLFEKVGREVLSNESALATQRSVMLEVFSKTEQFQNHPLTAESDRLPEPPSRLRKSAP